MFIIIDILPFVITDSSRIFIESMHQEDITFKIQYILQSLATIDTGFTYNITHDSDNNLTGIFWITSYIRENFEWFGTNISIGVMKTQVCNAKEFCYIVPVVWNEIGKKLRYLWRFCNIRNSWCIFFILNSLLKMCIGRKKGYIPYHFR